MFSTLLRTTVLYFFVTFAIRIMGKRQIGDMHPNELVITLLISEIAAIPLQDENQPLLNGITAVASLAIIEIFISVLSLKFFKVRKLISGNSVILINNGKIDQNALKQVRLTVIDLIELLRAQNYFDVNDISFAVLEVNGGLSVIPKAHKRPLETGDIKNITAKQEGLMLPVISDGKPVYDSMKLLNIDKEQLKKAAGENDLSRIFLMTLDSIGNKTVILKENKK